MDTFAHGLKVAAKLIKDEALSENLKARYASYDSGIGAQIESGTATLESLETYTLKHGEPNARSGKQELLENVLNQYILTTR